MWIFKDAVVNFKVLTLHNKIYAFYEQNLLRKNLEHVHFLFVTLCNKCRNHLHVVVCFSVVSVTGMPYFPSRLLHMLYAHSFVTPYSFGINFINLDIFFFCFLAWHSLTESEVRRLGELAVGTCVVCKCYKVCCFFLAKSLASLYTTVVKYVVSF